MYRKIITYLNHWKNTERSKPLILRGARQVGKSYIVRELGKKNFKKFIEINFEKNKQLAKLFESKNPKQIVPLLELHFKTEIEISETLIFLDEIQVAPEVLTALRYFYEEMPELHILAAGSLLDLALEEGEFSVPVGRIEYAYLGPMSFEEFLLASGESQLVEFIQEFEVGNGQVNDFIHTKLLTYVKLFCALGGMPEVLSEYVSSKESFIKCDLIRRSILSTYEDDFQKYSKRISVDRIRKVFNRLPFLVGSKLKFSQIDADDSARNLKKALEWLCAARVAHKVSHTKANGIPLRAQIDENHFKPLFLDIGLMASALGISYLDLQSVTDLLSVEQGKLTEQFVGQHLLYSGQVYEAPELFYWEREKVGSKAEVDYLLQVGPKIIPVEVKSGKAGKMKSLNVFMSEKKLPLAIRISSDQPSIKKTSYGYTLITLPLYMVEQVRRVSQSIK